MNSTTWDVLAGTLAIFLQMSLDGKWYYGMISQKTSSFAWGYQLYQDDMDSLNSKATLFSWTECDSQVAGEDNSIPSGLDFQVVSAETIPVSMMTLRSIGDNWQNLNHGDTPSSESDNWRIAMGRFLFLFLFHLCSRQWINRLFASLIDDTQTMI